MLKNLNIGSTKGKSYHVIGGSITLDRHNLKDFFLDGELIS